jgi:hypothetical protein
MMVSSIVLFVVETGHARGATVVEYGLEVPAYLAEDLGIAVIAVAEVGMDVLIAAVMERLQVEVGMDVLSVVVMVERLQVEVGMDVLTAAVMVEKQ